MVAAQTAKRQAPPEAAAARAACLRASLPAVLMPSIRLFSYRSLTPEDGHAGRPLRPDSKTHRAFGAHAPRRPVSRRVLRSRALPGRGIASPEKSMRRGRARGRVPAEPATLTGGDCRRVFEIEAEEEGQQLPPCTRPGLRLKLESARGSRRCCPRPGRVAGNGNISFVTRPPCARPGRVIFK